MIADGISNQLNTGKDVMWTAVSTSEDCTVGEERHRGRPPPRRLPQEPTRTRPHVCRGLNRLLAVSAQFLRLCVANRGELRSNCCHSGHHAGVVRYALSALLQVLVAGGQLIDLRVLQLLGTP
jgi:hypothetical protein